MVAHIEPLRKVGAPIYRLDLIPYLCILYAVTRKLILKVAMSESPNPYETMSQYTSFCAWTQISSTTPFVNSYLDLVRELPPHVTPFVPLELVPQKLMNPLLDQENSQLLVRVIILFSIAITFMLLLLPVWSHRYKRLVMFSKPTIKSDATHILLVSASGYGTFLPLTPGHNFQQGKAVKAMVCTHKYKQYAVCNYGDAKPALRTLPSCNLQLGIIRIRCSQGFKLREICTPDRWVHKTNQTVKEYMKIYGDNLQRIRIPGYGELSYQQATQPLLIFQLFCMLLYFLDDMWKQTIVSLMLCGIFEIKQIFGRRSHYVLVSTMRMKPVVINVFRANKWWAISSNDLIPGDVYSPAVNSEEPNKDPWPNHIHHIPKLRGAGEGGRFIIPADSVIIGGNIILDETILTGESFPQMKTALPCDLNNEDDNLELRGVHSNHAVYSGTTMLLSSQPGDSEQVPHAGDVVLYCLRTGFNTDQGKLLRTVLTSKTQTSADTTWESIAFLCALTVVALVTALYILAVNWGRPNRNNYKLLLHCAMIITAVVPPELPMTLSMTLNRCVGQLVAEKLFCTAPQRLVNCGKVTTCCFDKTGTLTSANMKLVGVLEGSQMALVDKEFTTALNLGTRRVMGLCHSLVNIKNTFVLPPQLRPPQHQKQYEKEIIPMGDPLEIAAQEAAGFTCNSMDPNHNVCTKSGDCYKIVKRYPFSSELQRMTVVCEHAGELFVVMKGAPSRIAQHVNSVPANYHNEVMKITSKGQRALSLAYKVLNNVTASGLAKLTRDELETNLVFVGTMYFACDIKEGTISTIRGLLETGHAVKMITGDDALTASTISSDCGIVPSGVKFSSLSVKNTGEMILSDLVSDKELIASTQVLKITRYLKDTFGVLIISGKGLREMEKYLSHESFGLLLKIARIFARVKPSDKELIVSSFNHLGEVTLMCGDGTNDVGALKAADVGISLLDSVNGEAEAIAPHGEVDFAAELEPQSISRIRRTKAGMRPNQILHVEGLEDRMVEMRDRSIHLPIRLRKVIFSQLRHSIQAYEDKSINENLNKATRTSVLSSITDDSEPVIKMGDASMAAPFTYRGGSISSVNKLLRIGKAALAHVMMMYKLNALNALTTAFSMAVLTYAGVKYGETQLIAEGMFSMVLYGATMYARPGKKLTRDRVIETVYEPRFYISVILQSFVHISSCYIGTKIALKHSVLANSLDGPFRPNLLNTVVILLNQTQHVSTFIANYEGAPFISSWSENSVLRTTLIVYVIAIIFISLEVIPSANIFLQLVKLPTAAFKLQVLSLMVYDLVAASFVGIYCTYVGRSKRFQDLVNKNRDFLSN